MSIFCKHKWRRIDSRELSSPCQQLAEAGVQKIDAGGIKRDFFKITYILTLMCDCGALRVIKRSNFDED